MSAALPVIFSRRRSLGSLLIRAGSWWGPWSHCAIIDFKADQVVEAVAFEGVRTKRLSAFIKSASETQIVFIECPRPEDALAFAYSQLGKPYDYGGVLGFPFREPWHSENRWFCSEFLERSLMAGGRQRFRIDTPRVTPYHSWIVS